MTVMDSVVGLQTVIVLSKKNERYIKGNTLHSIYYERYMLRFGGYV